MECDVGDDELWEEIGARLGVAGPQAFGHYGWFTGRYGERWIRGKIKGRLDTLQDATIEKWARWAGTPGAFAAALRELCTDADSGELKGFRRRNAKILLKQLRDAQKKKDGIDSAPLREPPLESALLPPNNQHANDDGDDNGYGKDKSSSTAGGGEVSAIEYAQQCTVACNKGLRENPAVKSAFRELVSSNQLTESEPWRQLGVPVDFAAQAVYGRALAYQPKGSNRQPSSLRYFDRPVREAWEREQGRSLEGGFKGRRSGPTTETDHLDEYEQAARRLEEEDKAHAG